MRKIFFLSCLLLPLLAAGQPAPGARETFPRVNPDGSVSFQVRAPEGGFKNGKYYYGEMTMVWQKCIIPTITGATPTLVNYDFNLSDEDMNVTIGGNSEGYRFVLQHGGTITLDNVTASLDGSSFIYQYVDPEEHLTLVLTGDNKIKTTNDRAIYLEGCNELRLKCTGDSATLTVSVPSWVYCGLGAYNYAPDYAVQLTDWRYNKNKTTGDLDMTEQLAAEGFYVIRGPRMEHYDVDNNASWYTWEFEVSAE